MDSITLCGCEGEDEIVLGPDDFIEVAVCPSGPNDPLVERARVRDLEFEEID